MALNSLPGTDRWTGPGTVGGVQGQIDGQDLGQWGVSRDRYMDRTWDRGGCLGTDIWTGPGTEGGV